MKIIGIKPKNTGKNHEENNRLADIEKIKAQKFIRSHYVRDAMKSKETPEEKRKGPGRPKGSTNPYKLTEEVQDRIVRALILGEPKEIAAKYGRIAWSTFYEYVNKGEKLLKAQEKGQELTDEELKYVNFFNAVEDALMESEIRAAHAIDVGSTGIKTHVVEKKYDKDGNITSEKEYDKYILEPDWRAAESKLSRRYPDRWGNKDKITHEGSKDNPIVTATLADFVKNAALRARERAAKEKEREKGEHGARQHVKT